MTKPQIKPLGVGDLKVVKQKLARYEAGEIAHIENIMASESRNREHRRLRQVEETLVSEKERQEENVRDLQSTERFEMQSESQRTIKSDTRFEAGLEVSADYGPVSIRGSTKFATGNSKEESDRSSTKFGKELIERTLAKLTERTREERRIRTLEEFEEKNQHGFDNTEGGPISGVYRWVDKYYRSKIVDYGKRLMYEFFVPEPAAFYLFATQEYLENQVLPTRPAPPTRPGTSLPLGPADISRFNYLELARQYNAQGIQSPPPDQVVIAKAISREFQSDDCWSFANEELKIPKGYSGSYGWITGSYLEKMGDVPVFRPVVPVWQFRAGTGRVAQQVVDTGFHDLGNNVRLFQVFFLLDGETALVPISGSGFGFRAFAIQVEVSCNLLSGYFMAWQLETHAAIMNAYHKALMDYEERLAASQIQQGVQIGGDNPLINREIEKEQLKKGCLTLWTDYDFQNPAGIRQDPAAAAPDNYPEIDQANSRELADQIEFFERAFDWKNMTYEFHPYYWGRKSHWLDVYTLENSDPIFEQFLKAGSARVVVPVRPAYAEAVLYYQLTGDIWNGGPVPPLAGTGDPEAELYNCYLDEIRDLEQVEDVDQDIEILPDDPETWLIKVPTDLIWLQSDSGLPNFENQVSA